MNLIWINLHDIGKVRVNCHRWKARSGGVADSVGGNHPVVVSVDKNADWIGV
ncbi:hypothetical protein J2T20_002574 [Paenibacillus wynnii]|nr:hypothetical protein [Paenibacillus wynnii]